MTRPTYSAAQRAELPARYAREKRLIASLKRGGTFLGRKPRYVNVEDLSDVPVNLHHAGREEEAERAYRAGIQMRPIEIGVDEQGRRYVIDGNHRLGVARRLGIKTIWTIFHEGAEHLSKPSRLGATPMTTKKKKTTKRKQRLGSFPKNDDFGPMYPEKRYLKYPEGPRVVSEEEQARYASRGPQVTDAQILAVLAVGAVGYILIFGK